MLKKEFYSYTYRFIYTIYTFEIQYNPTKTDTTKLLIVLKYSIIDKYDLITYSPKNYYIANNIIY